MTRTIAATPRFSLVLPSEGLAEKLTSVINVAYARTEDDFWKTNAVRTSVPEVTQLVAAQRFYKLTAPDDGDALVGCIMLTRVSQEVVEFGMLAIAEAALGRGYGNLIMREAEREARDKWQASEIQLSLLIPVDRARKHTFKATLKNWYERMGYVNRKTLTLEETVPHLCAIVAMEMEMLIFNKALVPTQHNSGQ